MSDSLDKKSDSLDNKDEKLLKPILPSDYMRARRPEQFSDSREFDDQTLERGYFEYHLSTLTSRGEEKLFEHFARKISEKLICPNLIPQTGPTGGGDSKVDTETYPVSSEISDRWFLGSDAGTERWGFAFSAKQDWRSKCKSDLQKIAGTRRDYKRVYFVTSQFVSDRKRAELEDELSNEYGFSVRILDRSWLIEAVIDKGNEKVAIDTLKLDVPKNSKKEAGPGDQSKRGALDLLEGRIADLALRPNIDLNLVDDCLDSAVLSRELEEPREVTEGRFDRAERFARMVGVERLLLLVLYQRAWTACYWFDDFSAVSTLYDEIESIALSSNRIENVECAVNIWQSLYSLDKNGLLAEKIKFQERTEKIIAHLEKVAAALDQPNNAANAKGFLLLVRLTTDQHEEQRVAKHLSDFSALFEGAQKLGGFRFQRFCEVFRLIGQVFGEHPVYDEVFETVLEIVEQRNSEIAAGQQLFERGVQKINANHPYDAIRFLGRAMARFIKEEERRHLESCLAGLSQAYNRCGLFWAEYTALMSLLSMLFVRYDDDRSEHVHSGLKTVSSQLAWNGLCTGDVVSFLHFFKLERVFGVSEKKSKDEQEGSFDYSELRTNDVAFAVAILQAKDEQSTTLAYFPDHLEKMGLMFSSFAINFKLGGIERLRNEKFVHESTGEEEIWETISNALAQPVRQQISDEIELRDGKSVVFTSMLLGLKWKVVVDNDAVTMRVAKSFLGFLEAVLATSLTGEVVPTSASIELRFVNLQSESPETEPLLSLSEDTDINFWKVGVNAKRFERGSEYMVEMRDRFVEFFSKILPTTTVVRDVDEYLERIIGLEEGFNRALVFSDMVTASSNVFLEEGDGSIEDLIVDTTPVEQTVTPGFRAKLRSVVGADAIGSETKNADSSWKLGIGEPPSELVDSNTRSHRQHRVISPINVRKWEKAKWSGVGVGMSPGVAPILGLLFKNESAAKNIFKDWREAYGEEDVNDDIRVAIVQGLSTNDPHGYGVIVGGNWQSPKMQSGDVTLSISRMNYMEHPNPKNLEMFKREYQSIGGYLLAPALTDDGFKEIQFLPDYGIGKRHLHLRAAWEIGESDPDGIIIQPYHEPIVPEGEVNPPIQGLMKLKRDRAKRENLKDFAPGKDKRKKNRKKMWRP